MFANTQMAGQSLAFPDVCLTPAPPGPPIPVPYPNIAMSPMAVGAAYNVLIDCMPAHNMGTVVPLTNGDNAGIGTGVASGMVMGQARHLTGAFTVLVGGKPATRLSSMSLQNGTNAPGCQIVPSQVKVLMLAP
ncbi:DUF4150 domain-containing protein [Caldimonas thermodepolymerans]|jgi:hypothetical protein|uniref:Type VI secretion protein n=1 Tax=Caldimonas thermodepolymerans TaxID=215580 RepID=A0A2S5T797_9BURK|nr:DUF4150 domain-containing protein [Caldimonas thermodepolymerans]PPE70819.1 type VI secretion protein [Caldimonas thermodepolymerans]QPC33037.1 DUF4150 domain-containing protein [Caldimonas thermodepolymerans]RDI03823.1 uncharacterized protein DUF4150 [Caldimonas thermodepolymerans]TCP09790.1 uncharacterized protein DUF4150 [Caldimonas thermodepolymerans]UZG45906.1 DUF4150 domain-containing protein [Caldimonas thermodepolymerans]